MIRMILTEPDRTLLEQEGSISGETLGHLRIGKLVNES